MAASCFWLWLHRSRYLWHGWDRACSYGCDRITAGQISLWSDDCKVKGKYKPRHEIFRKPLLVRNHKNKYVWFKRIKSILWMRYILHGPDEKKCVNDFRNRFAKSSLVAAVHIPVEICCLQLQNQVSLWSNWGPLYCCWNGNNFKL